MRRTVVEFLVKRNIIVPLVTQLIQAHRPSLALMTVVELSACFVS